METTERSKHRDHGLLQLSLPPLPPQGRACGAPGLRPAAEHERGHAGTEKEQYERVTRRRRPGSAGSRRRWAAARRCLRAVALRRGGLPRAGYPVTGRRRSPP
jgi:hypothetical protein